MSDRHAVTGECFIVFVTLELPPTVHVHPARFDDDPPLGVQVTDLDHVRPAAVEDLTCRLFAELAEHLELAAAATCDADIELARAGVQLVELYASYVAFEEGSTLRLAPEAAAVFLEHGIDPERWGWTISPGAADAAAG